MILIFDKEGKYFNEAKTVNDAAELTGNLAGNVSQIINGFYGNMTAKGFYFVRYDRKESEFEKQIYIDKLEKVLEVMTISWQQNPLQDRIDKLIAIIKI